MWAPPKGDGEAAESVSTLANVEGEKAGGVAASSGEEVGPMGSAVGPAAAPSAATWRNIETNSVLWLGVSGSPIFFVGSGKTRNHTDKTELFSSAET
jgi:hypothetical protein